MKIDVVKRLRAFRVLGIETDEEELRTAVCTWHPAVCTEAADEIERLRALVECLLENDPNDMAADAVTVLEVWRREARKVLGA